MEFFVILFITCLILNTDIEKSFFFVYIISFPSSLIQLSSFSLQMVFLGFSVVFEDCRIWIWIFLIVYHPHDNICFFFFILCYVLQPFFKYGHKLRFCLYPYICFWAIKTVHVVTSALSAMLTRHYKRTFQVLILTIFFLLHFEKEFRESLWRFNDWKSCCSFEKWVCVQLTFEGDNNVLMQ